MDRHRIAEERSLAYHRAIAARLQAEPALVERARARVQTWLSSGESTRFYAREWARILAGSLGDVADAMCDANERGRELRQSTPFAGALSARERWRIWRDIGERLAGGT